MKRDDNAPDLLPPDVDPNTLKIGIRKVSARNEAGTRTVVTVRDHRLVTDEPLDGNTGPTPLETTLAGLAGCKGVIINRCARAMRFKYSAVEIEADGEVDGRGSRGVRGVRPYFNWVKLKIRLHSHETPERLARLKGNVEYRCPVMNLFREADVDIEADWELVPE
ncbi:MAG: OsmC family protein [Rhodospirillales bacterium]|nr:MAG: OsmC family protein [Rhodospirillales bacterium]